MVDLARLMQIHSKIRLSTGVSGALRFHLNHDCGLCGGVGLLRRLRACGQRVDLCKVVLCEVRKVVASEFIVAVHF